ncbi:MAG: hypothetical protein ABR570_08980 [Burkholderiales bacterium]
MTRFALALVVLAIGGCSLAPLYYPTLNEHVVALHKGDLEASGIAFVTPSTVTGLEQEKQAVALTFTDVLASTRPGIKVVSLAETLSAVNRAGLVDAYRRMYEDYRNTALLPADVLRRLSAATGARYIAQLSLQGFMQNSKNRLGILGLRIIDTQLGDLRLHVQIWDSHDGSIAWEAMEELRIAKETTREEPIMLRTLLERSARDLVAKLP